MKRSRHFLILAALVPLMLAADAPSPNFIVDDPVGQKDFRSCQSYALAVALAFKRDPQFAVSTWRDLRTVESGIRGQIEAARDARQAGSDVTHADIVAGFAHYTGNAHKLKMQSIDTVGLGDLINSTTGVTDARQVAARFLLPGSVGNVVLSSATRIEGTSYRQGHIFSILGMDGPPNSSRRYLVLNSAASRDGRQIGMCRDDLPDDAGPYTAYLKWVVGTDIDFKTFNGKIAAWTVN